MAPESDNLAVGSMPSRRQTASLFEIVSKFTKDFRGRGSAEVEDEEITAWINALLFDALGTGKPHQVEPSERIH